MTSAGEVMDWLIGSTIAVGCSGSWRRDNPPCDALGRVFICDPGYRFVCHEHWREVAATRWFHKSDMGTFAANNDDGVWIYVEQGFDLDLSWPPHTHLYPWRPKAKSG